MQGNPKRKKIHRMNQGLNFLEAALAIESLYELPSNLEEKVIPASLNTIFHEGQTHLFLDQLHQLFDRSNETKVEI